MEQDISMRRLTFIDGLKGGIPVCLGYFPIAMAFGMMSKNVGLNLYETLGFSFIVFAGAAQFIAIGLIAGGVSGYEIIITTLFLNFRHFLMSASLAPKLQLTNPLSKLFISFYVTDESFSVASFAEGKITGKYMVPMELLGYLGWGIGSGTGYFVGQYMPPLVQLSMNIGLYAMFIALLVPEMKKTNKAIVLALLSGVLNSILRFGFDMQQGWSVVVSIVVISIVGVAMYNNEHVSEVMDID